MEAKRIVTVAADTPFFPEDLVERLRMAASDAPIALAATLDGDRGRCFAIQLSVFGRWTFAKAFGPL